MTPVPLFARLRRLATMRLLTCGPLAIACASGCQSGAQVQNTVPIVAAQRPAVSPAQSSVVPAAYVERASPAPADCDDPFAGVPELLPAPLVAEVLRRNPSLEAMEAAAEVAAAKYPQVVSLEDPMLSLAMGPGTFGDPNHDVAWMVEGSQKIPWHGKRELRGRQAQAEASAARLDVADADLRLVESTKLALLDYYLVHRDLELNAEGVLLIQGFRETADAHYRNLLVTQQDILQADLELNDLRRRKLELERMDRVAVARINTLLHRPPAQPLPPPPKELPAAIAVPAPETMLEIAAQRRPDLIAIGARLRAEQAAAALAERDYYPDVTVVGRYDGFWQRADRNLAPMVGLNLNVPLDNDRRRGALREAQFRVNQRRAEYEARLDEIHNDVESSYQQLVESRRALELFDKSILPVAEHNLDSARGNYSATKIDFLRLIEADRQLITLREKRQQVNADYYRSLAAYERASGGPLPESPATEIIPPGHR
jgi:outer membrane protein, heavy metal efflux system